MDFYEKRKLKRILYSKITLIILAIIVILLFRSVWGMYEKERNTRILRAKQTQELNELKGREEALRAEIERLSTEQGVEEEIRSKFDVGKDGEEVIVIIDDSKKDETEQKITPKSFWQKLFSWF